MTHWLQCLQDVWWVAKWVLPPMCFVFAGMGIVSDDSDTLHYLIAGILFYIAAVMGWWL